MNAFINLPTRTKLMLGCALIAVGILTAAAVVYSAFNRVAWSAVIATESISLENNLNRQRADLLGMMLARDRTEQEAAIEQIKLSSTAIDAIFARLLVLAEEDAALASRLGAVAQTRRDFQQTRDTQVIPAILEGNHATAQELVLGIQRKRYLEMRAEMQLVGQQAAAIAERRVRQSMGTFIFMGLLLLALALGLYVAANSFFVRPLAELTLAADRIAEGDLSVNLAGHLRRDEVGTLTRSFGQMLQSLREMAAAATRIATGDLRVSVPPRSAQDALGHAFAGMVQNFKQLTKDMTAAIEVLVAAVSEITSSARQMATGSTQSAAAVRETLRTIEEVRQAASVASERAEHIVEKAQTAMLVAQGGSRAAATTNERVKDIRQQMDFIGASMIRLTEQTHVIGDIIASVDEIAEQSNLLAVNAAIEASKAGEQGKGFAVVAQEVRGLAERSRRATTEVRNILGEIQKATNAAVMAAERGGKSVQAGVTESLVAGDALQATAANVTESTQAISQIALTSRQQLAGVEQVATAMSSIASATTQSMGGARELEVSARNLSSLAQTLKKLIATYQTT